jgi:DNA polymerase (family 10)
MTNEAIAANFSLLAKLMDIHGDNSFKAKTYSNAAFTIDKLPIELSTLPPDRIFSQKGIGESTGKKVLEQLETGQLQVLQEYILKTPPGILEMLQIKGIGPKKIATIWKELEIETLGELLYACNENRLTLYKGFGEKTQENIRQSIEFYFNSLGSYLYQQMEVLATVAHERFTSAFPDQLFALTGHFRMQREVIDHLDWVTTSPASALIAFLQTHQFTIEEEQTHLLKARSADNVTLVFHITDPQQFSHTLFKTSCSEAFLQAWEQRFPAWESHHHDAENAVFASAGIPYIPPYLREEAHIIEQAINKGIPTVIEPSDIQGIIHSHSKWSDGSNTLAEMATAAIDKGLSYLVISDHSRSAFYASGLDIERVQAQHAQIDELNQQLAPFRIYKSIESDILNDGSLDYPDEVLASFDLVIASIHSNLKMPIDKAMMRLMNAIENPYTSILGHMTGRLLLSRNGYPVDHEKIIDACAANQVVIELNAHPRRLDIDWRWISKALDKNVLISINPDAHAIEGYDDCKYGVWVAQKAGLTKEQNLSSFSREAFESFLVAQHSKRP